MSRFLGALHSGRVLLMDGAMGTELQRAGIREGECYELWNLTHPDRVRAIHQAYLDAGAECLLTHTFQANPAVLTRHGQLKQWKAIHQAAFGLAKGVCGPNHFLLADLGPYLWLHAPVELEESYPSLICSLKPDAVLLETMSHQADLLDWIHDRVQHQAETRVPLLFSATYGRDSAGQLGTGGGKNRKPHPPEYFAEWAEWIRERKWNRAVNVAALGVNCGRDIGMDEILEIIRRYRKVTDLPLFARPNAGTPTRIGDRWVYPHTPEKMAARLPELLEAGVTLVGGCCGTTPEHIAAFRPIMDDWNARHGRSQKRQDP